MLRNANAHITDLPAGSLVLEQLPSGEWAWLRPEPHPVRVVHDLAAPLPPTDRVALTDLGRRALAMYALFGAWPTMAEASAC